LINIRQEHISDYDEVYRLVKISFATSSHADGTESDYLNEVRKKKSFIPELSLVSENEERKIVGQIVLCQTIISTDDGKQITELLLSPICVHPDYFRQGIAMSMMKRAFAIAKDMGYTAVFLCGDPDFYNKIGFKATYKYNIYHVDDKEKNAEWSMVYELFDGVLNNISGTINTQ